MTHPFQFRSAEVVGHTSPPVTSGRVNVTETTATRTHALVLT
ncbi:hypothetical protein [Pseudorhodobacter sp.]|nr:hypothetical protein [Pseudorhodobacter sp.]